MMQCLKCTVRKCRCLSTKGACIKVLRLSTEGARIEALQAPRGRGVGRGWYGFLISKRWVFLHFGWYYFPFRCPFYSQKWCFWSSKTNIFDQNITQLTYLFNRNKKTNIRGLYLQWRHKMLEIFPECCIFLFGGPIHDWKPSVQDKKHIYD